MSVLDDIARLFEEQVGVRERPNNDVIYNTDYYGAQVNGAQYPWCAAFIWDVFRMAGHSSLFIGGEKSAYCPYIEGWAKKNGQWVTSGYRKGDLVLFDWDGDGVADHIGFVLDWSGSKGTTIEGNADDMVQRLVRYADHVKGAYRPVYPASGDSGTPAPAPVKPSVPDKETAKANTYTVREGDSLWRIAAQFLGNGVKYPAIMELNGLKNAAIYPGQVLLIPSEDDRRTFTVTVSPETYRFLTDAATNDDCTVGQIIDRMVEGKL